MAGDGGAAAGGHAVRVSCSSRLGWLDGVMRAAGTRHPRRQRRTVDVRFHSLRTSAPSRRTMATLVAAADVRQRGSGQGDVAPPVTTVTGAVAGRGGRGTRCGCVGARRRCLVEDCFRGRGGEQVSVCAGQSCAACDRGCSRKLHKYRPPTSPTVPPHPSALRPGVPPTHTPQPETRLPTLSRDCPTGCHRRTRPPQGPVKHRVALA